jgi:hypothetical protein
MTPLNAASETDPLLFLLVGFALIMLALWSKHRNTPIRVVSKTVRVSNSPVNQG